MAPKHLLFPTCMGENFYSCILGMGRVQIQPNGSVLANPIDKSMALNFPKSLITQGVILKPCGPIFGHFCGLVDFWKTTPFYDFFLAHLLLT